MDLELQDLDLILEDGDLKTTNNTLVNEVLIASTTNELDVGMDFNLGGWINEDIGNRIWILLYQSAFNSTVRSEVKSELRQSLLDYGNIEYSIINANDGEIKVNLELELNSGLKEKFDLIIG